jgi:hypothetical protein
MEIYSIIIYYKFTDNMANNEIFNEKFPTPEFSNPLSQKIAAEILDLNNKLEAANADFRLIIIGPETPLGQRPSGAQMLVVSDNVEERLPGFPDLRLQKREGKGIIAQHGFRLENPVSGMTISIVSTRDHEVTVKELISEKGQPKEYSIKQVKIAANTPLAVANYILFNPIGTANRKYVRKTDEGLEVINFKEAFGWGRSLPNILTPGWHYVKPEYRFNLQIVKTGMELANIIVGNLQKSFPNKNAAVIVVEQNGVFDEIGGDIDFLVNAKHGTKFSKDDSAFNVNEGKNLHDLVGTPTNDSSGVRSGALRSGLKEVPGGIVHMETLGPIFFGSVHDWEREVEG